MTALVEAPPARRERALNGSAWVIAWILLAVAIALPVYAYWHSAQPPSEVAARVSVPPTPAAQVATLPASVVLPAGVPVLAYGEISNRVSPWTVTPRELDAQLASLRASGFHAVSAAQLVAWLHGRADLPSRPVLLTFDGATKSAWRYVDLMLARYGQRAAAMPVTGRVGTHQPYYLNWPELRRMRATGRWDVGSNTRAGTGQIQVNPAGRERGYMANLQWLRQQRKRETLAQYRVRIARDLDASIADMRRNGLPRPVLFAFPHSVEAAVPNDGRIPATLSATVGDRFPAVLDTVNAPGFARPDAAGPYMHRIGIPRGLSGAALLERIVRAGHRTGGVQP